MDATIQDEEIFAALRSMPKGKTSGQDGIPTEFYLTFYNLLIPLLQEIFNHAATFGELPEDFLNGDIILLPKVGDPTSCNNKRPITLLNFVFKIFTTIWQRRLAGVAESLVTWNQSAFLKGRSFQHTVLLCSEVLHFARTMGLPTMFLKIDFRKAFDSLHWEFIQRLFRKMGFGLGFDRILQAITLGSSSQMLVNGHWGVPSTLLRR